jgi:hypothetical protein
MELRIFAGIFIIAAMTDSAFTLAPSAKATAQASRTQDSSCCFQSGAAMTAPVVRSATVVVNAKRGEEHNLAPHERLLVLHEPAFEPHFLKLVESRAEQTPSS